MRACGAPRRSRRGRASAGARRRTCPDAEAGQLSPGDHQRLLHRVLGQADVAENAACDPVQHVPARAGQDGERLPVAALGLLDEIAIHSLRPVGGAHRVRRPSLQSAHHSSVFNLRWDASKAGSSPAPGGPRAHSMCRR
jgi:hypothetical protein